MTPMQEQYNRIKEEYKEYILLFRLGDFYECFNNDAKTVSKILGITLTGRGKDENRIAMAGIPHHALKTYLPKLINEGLKIAIADQLEEATPGKLVERSVTKVITPGTILDENILDNTKNNYLASLTFKDNYYLTYSDISTGELYLRVIANLTQLKNELSKLDIKEILIQKGIPIDKINLTDLKNIEEVEINTKEYIKYLEILKQHFKLSNLKSFGIEEDNKYLILSIGKLIEYIYKTQKTDVKHINKVKVLNDKGVMKLDYETIRNLELIYSNNGNNSLSLYSTLNKCITSFGKRMLRNWILNPLTDISEINERLNSVEFFFNNPRITSEIREYLNNISDFERITGKIGVNIAHPKDILGLKMSLENSLKVLNTLKDNKYINTKFNKLESSTTLNNDLNNNILDLINIINTHIDEDAPSVTNVGNIFKEGINTELDKLRNLKRDSKKILSDMQVNEIEKTGISSLKISFNNVFGYYIEVTKTHLNKVPDRYIRKQTLANAERYITEELKKLEEEILSSEFKIIEIESKMFNDFKTTLIPYIPNILTLSNLISEIDIYSNAGLIARENEYVKPILLDLKDNVNKGKENTSNILNIVDGRHPVVEKLTTNFVPNNLNLDDTNIIKIITGPNMSGKSTYIRANALIVLMAQIGFFVPAKSMEFNIIDRVFTRVGASDNLSRGESTFMVEMIETSNILNNATSNSFVILDEVGRGTSTYDGVAIAWSILEFIQSNIKSRTLFATHYHELITLSSKYKEIGNLNVEVLDNGSDIQFKHKIIKGSASKSYGVHVAKLAGIPESVVNRANEILKSFEENNSISNSKDNKKDKSNKPSKPRKISPDQLGLI